MATAGLAGPPLVCHRIDIGSAESLPWRNVDGWDGADVKYDTSRLVDDTLRILSPTAPGNVRMETLRRAAIYAARNGELAPRLSARLVERIQSNAKDGWAHFDAGYFVEAVRQTGFIFRYDMLSGTEKERWVQRGERLGMDGKPWLDKARQLGIREVDHVYPNLDAYRTLDLKYHAAKK
jgi:hypothetical protein